MQPEQQNTQPTSPSPQINQTPPQHVSFSQSKKHKGLVWKLLTVFFVLVLLAGVGGVSYVYYQEKKSHDDTKNQLLEVEQKLDDHAQVIQDASLESSYRKVLQDSANRQCSSGSSILFNTTTSPEKNIDGSVKKHFAVGQYVCNIGDQVLSGPVRFVVVQSYDEETWEFTYGSNGTDPVSLPGYIFNTDPALFNSKYNNPKSF